MTKLNAIALAIISAAALQVGPVFAQASPAAPAGGDSAKAMEAFDRADKNKDGKLSKEEADSMPAVAAKFAEMDVDKDGFISKSEYMDAMKK